MLAENVSPTSELRHLPVYRIQQQSKKRCWPNVSLTLRNCLPKTPTERGRGGDFSRKSELSATNPSVVTIVLPTVEKGRNHPR